MAEKTTTTALTTTQPRAVTRAMSADEMEEQIRQYFDMQRVLDRALPDAIMQIQGRQFRKKSYWRAIAVAFSIELELLSEQRVKIDSQWGYTATYRATLPSGRSMCGDGTCMSSEKRGASCTEHNVRAHCHTRAKNRAIADLVGFGEVTAEEVTQADLDSDAAEAEYTPAPRMPAAQPQEPQEADSPCPTMADIRRLADSLGVPANERKALCEKHGVSKGRETPTSLRALYAALVAREVTYD
jgi:hypothetical protein